MNADMGRLHPRLHYPPVDQRPALSAHVCGRAHGAAKKMAAGRHLYAGTPRLRSITFSIASPSSIHQTIDLENQVSLLNNDPGASGCFGKEYSYLWESPDSLTSRYNNGYLARQSYEGQQKIMGYFISENWNNYFYVLALGGLLLFLGLE